MKGTIPISTVLAEMKMGRKFSLLFVIGNGAREGEYKRAQVVYGKKGRPTKKHRSLSITVSKDKLHKYSSTIPLIDMSTGEPCTPYIYNLVEYNEHIIRH
jgi:hypothetical protein